MSRVAFPQRVSSSPSTTLFLLFCFVSFYSFRVITPFFLFVSYHISQAPGVLWTWQINLPRVRVWGACCPPRSLGRGHVISPFLPSLSLLCVSSLLLLGLFPPPTSAFWSDFCKRMQRVFESGQGVCFVVCVGFEWRGG